MDLDDLNSYYDTNLKESRLKKINSVLDSTTGKWKFYKASLENHTDLKYIFNSHSPTIVINLAAQAGVRYSIDNPSAYIQSNLDFLICLSNVDIMKLII